MRFLRSKPLLTCLSALVLLVPFAQRTPVAAQEQPAQAPFLPLTPELIPLDSDQGRQVLANAKHQGDFWRSVQYYSPQYDLGSCGVASSLIVLNTLPVSRPETPQYQSSSGSYRLFTPQNFFTESVQRIKTKQAISKSGMSLEQLGEILQTFSLDTQVTYASKDNSNNFREQLAKTLDSKQSMVLCNYLRRAIGQVSGGHISPLVAYSAKDDMVLILDTSNYKYPWVWVPTEALWKAMAEEVDAESGLSRGYVIATIPAN